MKRISPRLFHAFFLALCAAISLLASGTLFAEDTKEDPGDSTSHHRHPSASRHPGSYLAGGAGYSMVNAWLEENEDHVALDYGPVHGWQTTVRVGDAFAKWFSLGFQINLAQARSRKKDIRIGAFGLLLDTAFYPVRGLSLRPAVGLGFSYAQGDEDFKFGFGGPAMLSMSLGYELRVTKRFHIAPVAQVYWITKNDDDYDALVFFIGLDFIRWFETATG